MHSVSWSDMAGGYREWFESEAITEKCEALTEENML
jgi:hypothetical protein